MSQEPVPPLPPKSDSGTKGCLIGCAIVAAVGVVGTILIVFALYRASVETLEAFTETEPRPVPEVQMTEEEGAAARTKAQEFMSAVKSGESEEKEFRFTGKELNVLLRSNPDLAAVGDSVHVTIEDGEMKGQVSLDIGQFIPFLAGRYANGTATFDVSTNDGLLFVFIEDFSVKGEPAAPAVLEEVRKVNLAEDAKNDPEFVEFMNNVESVKVEGDQLIILLK